MQVQTGYVLRGMAAGTAYYFKRLIVLLLISKIGV